MDKYKPEGYNAVSPYLVVNEAHKMIDLLKVIFNAQVLRKYQNDNGSIMHAEVKIDDSVIMIADSNEMYPQNTFLLHVYVPDVDVIYGKAMENGCLSVGEPKQKEGEPDRRASFKDFSGNIWSVASQINQT